MNNNFEASVYYKKNCRLEFVLQIRSERAQDGATDPDAEPDQLDEGDQADADAEAEQPANAGQEADPGLLELAVVLKDRRSLKENLWVKVTVQGVQQ